MIAVPIGTDEAECAVVAQLDRALDSDNSDRQLTAAYLTTYNSIVETRLRTVFIDVRP